MAENTPVLGTNKIVQIGMVVKNIDQVAKDWAELLGVPTPSITLTDGLPATQSVFRGKPCPARAKLAFLNCGQLDIELIEPDENESVWREYLEKNGEGFHHIAFFVKGMKENIQKLEERGMKLGQTGEYTGGRYAYVEDVGDKYKMMFELLEND